LPDRSDLVGRRGLPPAVIRRHDSAVAETVEEAPEDPALGRQWLLRRRRGGALPGDRLVVVRAADRLDDLLVVPVLGAFELGDKTDEHPVAHHLRLDAKGAVGVPDRLASVAQDDPDAELIDPGLLHVRVDAAFAQGVDHDACPVLLHAITVRREAVSSLYV